MRFRYGFKRLADQGRHLMTSIYHLPFSVFLSFRGESQSVYGCEQLSQKKEFMTVEMASCDIIRMQSGKFYRNNIFSEFHISFSLRVYLRCLSRRLRGVFQRITQCGSGRKCNEN